MADDPEPNRKVDPEAWQAWFNRQVAQHDEDVSNSGNPNQDFEINPE